MDSDDLDELLTATTPVELESAVNALDIPQEQKQKLKDAGLIGNEGALVNDDPEHRILWNLKFDEYDSKVDDDHQVYHDDILYPCEEIIADYRRMNEIAAVKETLSQTIVSCLLPWYIHRDDGTADQWVHDAAYDVLPEALQYDRPGSMYYARLLFHFLSMAHANDVSKWVYMHGFGKLQEAVAEVDAFATGPDIHEAIHMGMTMAKNFEMQYFAQTEIVPDDGLHNDFE